jgi:hypothetical protein
MKGFGTRLAFGIALALLTAGSAGFARASILALDQLGSAQLQPSAIPALLGPINELGRNGWQCAPEHAAKAARTKDADLPADDGAQ